MSQNNKIVKAFFWNSLSSALMALQSVAMLMIITRIGTLDDAGIFAFGFSNANLFLHLGRFGMRNYQSSDVLEKHSFRLYRKTRIVTVGVMIIGCSGFVLISSRLNHYSEYKTEMLLLLCIMKAIDAYEDIYHGNYQQHGHLDMAGFLLTERILVSFATFMESMLAFRDINYALIISNLVSGLFVVCEILYVRKKIYLPVLGEKDRSDSVKIVLEECMPLFLTAFIAFMILNLPKYAIDFYLNDSEQAVFGFLFAPVLMISLLVNSLFQPYVSELAALWNDNKYHKFAKIFRKLEIVTIGLTIACILGVALLGIPLLQMIYQISLEPYQKELILLMLGGGFYAFSTLYLMGITIIRGQKLIGYMYLLLGFISGIIAFTFVNMLGLRGAVISYITLMFMEAGLTLIIFYRKLMILGSSFVSKPKSPKSAGSIK